MIVEGFRTDSLYIADTTIRVSQALSAVLMAVCLIALILLTIKFTKHPKPIDGVDFFLEEQLKAKKKAAESSDNGEKAEAVETKEEATENGEGN